MILSVIEKINALNDFLFAPVDKVFENLPFDEWVTDAIVDSIHLLPFLLSILLIYNLILLPKYSFVKKDGSPVYVYSDLSEREVLALAERPDINLFDIFGNAVSRSSLLTGTLVYAAPGGR